MATATQMTDLSTLLQQQHYAARQLLDTLADETRALTQTTPQGLADLLERKMRQISQIEENNQHIHRRFSDLGITLGSAHFLRMIANLDQTGSLKEQWNTVSDIMAECRARNEVNGKIIERNHVYCAHLLQTLIKQGRDTFASIYSADGKTSEQHGSRKLGTA
jgi:flagellar biosynthesis/type III secretory pathway chaperone